MLNGHRARAGLALSRNKGGLSPGGAAERVKQTLNPLLWRWLRVIFGRELTRELGVLLTLPNLGTQSLCKAKLCFQIRNIIKDENKLQNDRHGDERVPFLGFDEAKNVTSAADAQRLQEFNFDRAALNLDIKRERRMMCIFGLSRFVFCVAECTGRGRVIYDVKGSVCFVLQFALLPFSPFPPLWCKFQNKTGPEPLTQLIPRPPYGTSKSRPRSPLCHSHFHNNLERRRVKHQRSCLQRRKLQLLKCTYMGRLFLHAAEPTGLVEVSWFFLSSSVIFQNKVKKAQMHMVAYVDRAINFKSDFRPPRLLGGCSGLGGS